MNFTPLPTIRETLRLALISSMDEVLGEPSLLHTANIARSTTQDMFTTSPQALLTHGLLGSNTTFLGASPSEKNARVAMLAQAASSNSNSNSNSNSSNCDFESAMATLLMQESIRRERQYNATVLDLLLHRRLQRQAAKASSSLPFMPSWHAHPASSVPKPNPDSFHHFANASSSPQAAPAPIEVNQTLKALGSTLRCRSEPYIDCLRLKLSDAHYVNQPPPRVGFVDPFPTKIYRMLEDVKREGLQHIVSFASHGRAFAVHNIDLFVAQIMPRYFQQTKWSSFTRQLHLWGFKRIQNGPDVGGFYHELFLRGHPMLCLYLKRVGIPIRNVDRRKLKNRKVNNTADPDFYSMEPAY